MKTLSPVIQKIWPMLKFLQTDRQTGGQAKNYMPPIFQNKMMKYCKKYIHMIDDIQWFLMNMNFIFMSACENIKILSHK
jgi:UbiD family decarboxylase